MKFSFAVMALLLSGTSTFAATLSTQSAANNSVYEWGLPDTAAYGQTYTFASAVSLDSITYSINDSGTAINYTAYVYAWDAATGAATGSALASQSGSTAGTSGFADVSSSFGGVNLGAGSYVIFYQATSAGASTWRSVTGSDAYAGGGFVFQNNGGNLSQLTSSWTTVWSSASDLAFTLSYNDAVPAVPLPASGLLLMGGLAALTLARRKQV